jgi:hypothetical protein
MSLHDSVPRFQLEERTKSGANWFYWIAALSLVTSILSLAGGTWGFFISLGVTQFIDGVALALAQEVGWGFKVVAFVFDVVAAGVFALFGYFGAKRHSWAFLVGMVLYALDALVFILARHWLGLAFHAFALYSMFGGYRACAALVELDKQTPPPAPEPAAPTW